MTYSKEVTGKIVECWGLGFTAEETVKAIQEWKGITISLNTIYRHRHSLTAKELIDELLRKQMRDIAKEDRSDLRMKYRDKLLEKLIPQRIEALALTKQDITITDRVDLSQYSEEDKIAILDAYRRINKERSGPLEPTGIH